MHVAIEPADRPGFPHVENAENHKACGHPLPVVDRQRHQRDPHADKLVPDDAAVIVYPHVFGCLVAQIDADTDAEHHQQRIELPRQLDQQQPERNRRQ
ncbi:hypothetical protein D3C80_1763130 [compost metagenome]